MGRLTRASEHVIVQISYACKTMAGYHCFHLIFEVEYNLFTGRLVCSVNVLYMKQVTVVNWTGQLERQSMLQFRLV